MIFIHGDLGWDQLQLMISKSTTADLIKMYLKLDEFFQQQFRSSRRIFSTLASSSASGSGPGMSIRRKGAQANSRLAAAAPEMPNVEAQHHRHWQKVLRRVAGLEVATLPSPLPMTGTILGGTMELHGCHISLACFHGVNFKSKSWALFSLKDPCVSFATEAQEIPGEGNFLSGSSYLRPFEVLLFFLCSGSERHPRRAEPLLQPRPNGAVNFVGAVTRSRNRISTE